MSSVHPGRALKDLLAARTIVAPGAYDVLSARLIQEAGFPAVLLGSYAVSASQLGLPDLGLISDFDMARLTRQVAESVEIPVIADVDTGYNGGGLVNVARTVQMFEREGAACIQIEDQVSPKKAGMTEGRRVIPLEEMTAKIQTAVSVRSTPDFLIMARTDAQPIDEAIRRIAAYEQAGADIVYIEDFRTPDEVRQAAESVSVPLVYTMAEGAPMPWLTVDELARLGVRLIYYPITALCAATHAIRSALSVLAREGSTASMLSSLASFNDIADLCEDAKWRSIERAPAAD